MSRLRDIVLRQVFPPIPDRPWVLQTSWNWQAWHEGEEETGHCGWGKTCEEAIADLQRLDEERHEIEHPEEFEDQNDIA